MHVLATNYTLMNCPVLSLFLIKYSAQHKNPNDANMIDSNFWENCIIIAKGSLRMIYMIKIALDFYLT